MEHGLFVAQNKITLNEWFRTWIDEYKKNQVKLGTYQNYKKYYDYVLRDRLGDKRLADIRGEHIQKLYNDHNFFAVMLRTGMRVGEMQGLKYSGIDKKAKVLHVRRTLKYIEGVGYLEDTPKTRTSARDIPLIPALLELLEAQRRFWGFKVERMDRYLFCNENGEPLSRARIQSEIERTIRRIRETGHDFPRITSHVFRHTFAMREIWYFF